MELVLILRILLRRWWFVVLPPLVAAVLVLPQFLNQGPAVAGGYATSFKYSASQELNLPQRDGDYQDVWLASEFVVNAFTEWIGSSTFRDELGLALNDETVDTNLLSISADNQRSVGLVQMSYPVAEDLARLADAAILVLQTRNQAYFPHLGGTPAAVTLLDSPVIRATPPPIANRFGPLLQIAVALLAGIVLAFLAEYLDPTIRSQSQLEGQGIKVLARIPRHRS